MGGLGNQLFQWSFYKSLESKFGKKNVFIDDSFFLSEHVGTTNRKFLLPRFKKLDFERFSNNDIIGKNFIHVSDDFNFRKYPEIIDKDRNYYFDGYWQNENYFKHIEELIREQLIIKEYNLIESTSLHIRRTDYCKSNGYHPVLEVDYYQNALKIINHYNNLVVFSDDINWCKDHLKFKNINFVENDDEIEDLIMMSMCKHNIIANSTFSWWAAWLNKNPDKKVIAPKKWFGDHVNLNTSDLIPDSWIKI